MRAHDLLINWPWGGTGPLYLQVAESILEAIRGGRIPPGHALPGIRELADRLGVHRNTIHAALRELESQGCITARPRSGYFVEAETDRPAGAPGSALATSPGFDVPARLQPISVTPGPVLDLTVGVADARLAPTEALARAYGRALRLKGPELLGRPDFRGHRRLRTALAGHLAQQRALGVSPDQLMILRGSSMAVSLVAQALIGPRDGHVAVETPGDPMVWETLRQACGATVHGVPVDDQGLDVEALETLLHTTPLNLLVVSPQCHYPTGVALSEPRRARLLHLAQEYRFAILELDGEFDHLPGPGLPPRPLASRDTTGQVLYAGSLSRILAPGLRVSFLSAPGSLTERLARARQFLDHQGDMVQEWAISELILDGDLHRQLRRVKKSVLERRAALLDALNHGMADRLQVGAGPGAMGLWVKGIGKLEDPTRFLTWIRACGMRGLKLRPGSHFELGGQELACTRLGFSGLTPEELQKAVSLMQ